MNTFRSLASGAALALLLACGGASAPRAASAGPGTPVASVATALDYTDPAGSGWRLVKDPASTATRLVLDLVGPSGEKARGVGLTLRGDAHLVRFARFEDGAYVQDGGVFALASAPGEPRLLAGGVSGDDLMVGAFQKSRSESAKELGAPLLKVALELKPDGASTGTVPLSVLRARIVPEDISTRAKSRLEPVDVAVGTLSLH